MPEVMISRSLNTYLQAMQELANGTGNPDLNLLVKTANSMLVVKCIEVDPYLSTMMIAFNKPYAHDLPAKLQQCIDRIDQDQVVISMDAQYRLIETFMGCVERLGLVFEDPVDNVANGIANL